MFAKAKLETREAPTAERVKAPQLSLTRLGTAVILLGLITDCALRLLCPDALYFRTWEKANRLPYSEGPFDPSAHERKERAYGDLAHMVNVAKYRQIRPETFQTDAWGFRNPPGSGPVRVLIAGDSFTAGGAVSDQDTISAQLDARLGLRVYNAGQHRPEWGLTRHVMQRVGLQQGILIWQESERRDVYSHLPETQGGGLARLMGPERYRKAYQWYQAGETFAAHSPLKMVATRALRWLENDRILPNLARHDVVVGEMRNGDPMLFLPSEVNKTRKRPVASDFFAELDAAVRATGNQLLVVFVPDKYTVYSPLLASPAPPVSDPAKYLEELTRNIEQKGVRVLNLTGALREQAATTAASGQYNYWIDDTHWNAAGIRRSAELIAAELHAMQPGLATASTK